MFFFPFGGICDRSLQSIIYTSNLMISRKKNREVVSPSTGVVARQFSPQDIKTPHDWAIKKEQRYESIRGPVHLRIKMFHRHKFAKKTLQIKMKTGGYFFYKMGPFFKENIFGGFYPQIPQCTRSISRPCFKPKLLSFAFANPEVAILVMEKTLYRIRKFRSS